MKRVRFSGFSTGTSVTLSATQQGVTRGPLTVSAWKASLAGTFRVRASIEDHEWSDVTAGDVIETVAPGRIRVWVDQFAGWTNNDPRFLWVDVDYGERWDFQHSDHPDLPPANVLQRFAGTTAGYYPGVLSGHAMRGTDMAGNQVLTAQTQTLDQTVTVTVTDGLVTESFVFTVRLIHPDVYYADRARTYASTAPETDRRGSIYISRDGDFSGAPPARAETSNAAGIYHITISDGVIDRNTFRDQPEYPWSRGTPESAQFLFKAGEEYFPRESIEPNWTGINSRIGTWTHSGSSAPAIWNGQDVNLYDVDPGEADGLLASGFFEYLGLRVTDLVLRVSDYDPSDVTWREWWNILEYSGKSGTFTESVAGSLKPNGYTGELVTNGSGVYAQIIQDTGTQLIVRQVVTSSSSDNPATDPYDFVNHRSATQAFFADGDTLTGVQSGATCTFSTAGDTRQDRTRKTPTNGWSARSARGVLLDNVQIFGAAVGIGSAGPGFVMSDCLISKYWDYGASHTDGPKATWSESGVVTVQPLSYQGGFKNHATSVSPNRILFNVVDSSAPLTLVKNEVAHSSRRFSRIEEYSAHYCFAHTYGGHGAQHQPMHRLGTSGSDAEFEMTVCMYGGGYSGGRNQIQLSVRAGEPSPKTPTVIQVENCHLRADFPSGRNNFTCAWTNYVLRNCLLDHPTVPNSEDRDITWIGTGADGDGQSPDTNAVSPVIEFCTFTALSASSPVSTVADQEVIPADIRGVPIEYRNNAYVIDQTVLGTVDAGIAALADAPSDFDSLYRPLVTAQAYQNATGRLTAYDARGVARPDTTVSRGALEP